MTDPIRKRARQICAGLGLDKDANPKANWDYVERELRAVAAEAKRETWEEAAAEAHARALASINEVAVNAMLVGMESFARAKAALLKGEQE